MSLAKCLTNELDSPISFKHLQRITKDLGVRCKSITKDLGVRCKSITKDLGVRCKSITKDLGVSINAPLPPIMTS
jgi:hypothetical protein